MLDADDLLEIPIYEMQNDGKRTRAQPCLMHLSFKLRANPPQVSLAVMYRNHFYIEKALGNLIGLAQLLSFVSAEAGVGVGPLVCHSTLAQLDTETWGVGGVANSFSSVVRKPKASGSSRPARDRRLKCENRFPRCQSLNRLQVNDYPSGYAQRMSGRISWTNCRSFTRVIPAGCSCALKASGGRSGLRRRDRHSSQSGG